MDESGHGTHVAGIAGAVVDNNLGIAGVCPDCRIMALRAGLNLSLGAFLEDDDVASAIVYAADNGADVINMSWGDPRPSPLMRDVIEYAYQLGVVLVASSGNEAEESLFYPAGFDKTIAVGAIDVRSQVASFSNFGWNLDVVAPGVAIISAGLGGGYVLLSGTSMAAPFVSGLAGLLLSQDPGLSPEELRMAVAFVCARYSVPDRFKRGGMGRPLRIGGNRCRKGAFPEFSIYSSNIQARDWRRSGLGRGHSGDRTGRRHHFLRGKLGQGKRSEKLE